MASPTIATAALFNFAASGTGTPAAANLAAKFRVTEGGRVPITITAGASDITVTLQVSADDSTYNTTSAAANITAVSAVAIPARTSRTFEVLLRKTTDAYLRLLATGPGQGEIQIRGSLVQHVPTI